MLGSDCEFEVGDWSYGETALSDAFSAFNTLVCDDLMQYFYGKSPRSMPGLQRTIEMRYALLELA